LLNLFPHADALTEAYIVRDALAHGHLNADCVLSWGRKEIDTIILQLETRLFQLVQQDFVQLSHFTLD
jgi:hypothetical protein